MVVSRLLAYPRVMLVLIGYGAGAGAGAVLHAQADAPGARAAENITAASIAYHLAVLTRDSLADRGTPSPGLELTAQYLAKEFERLGLAPGASKEGWIQRYLLPGQLTVNYATSRVTFSAFARKDGKEIVLQNGRLQPEWVSMSFTGMVRFASRTVPEGTRGHSLESSSTGTFAPKALLVTGRHTTTSIPPAAALGKSIVYVPPTGLDSSEIQAVVDRLAGLGKGVVVVSDEDSATFARRQDAARRHGPALIGKGFVRTREDSGWAVHVRDKALNDMLTMIGVDLPHARADTLSRVRELPPFGARLRLEADSAADVVTAPNVIGVIEGRDSVLRNQCIIISTRMDHGGRGQGRTDSLAVEAGDNAVGLAGLLELAKAFGQPEARPRRSVMLVAVSGSANGFWGSTQFFRRRYATCKSTANITLDMSNREIADSIWVDGIDDVELPMRPNWVAAAHPELRLTAVNGGTAVRPTADHFPFVRKAVPSLYIYNRRDAEVPPGADSLRPEALDRAARRLRLVFHIGQSLANAPELPRWTSEGRRRRIEMNPLD
jgi:hypothetical protein